MKRYILPAAMLIAAACGSASPTGPTQSAPYSQTDLVVGPGAVTAAGSLATVAYTGWLYDGGRTDGKGSQFESNPSYTFRVGVGAVIKGWDQGVAGMRVGGQRRLVIPPELAYGNVSPGPGVPANATLVFDITLNGTTP